MIGKRAEQRELFDVGNVFPLKLDPTSYYGQLAGAAERLFADSDFQELYSATLGRPSVPPSLLARMLLLQHYAGCSDAEAVARSAFDLRWAAVLGRAAGEPLCAKSTFEEFRAQLVIHEGARAILQRSIAEAKQAGLLKRGTALRTALDTKPVLGKGAVEDTFNLLGRGIVQLAGALAKAAGCKVAEWAAQYGLGRYFGSSLKASAEIDWSDAGARQQFLSEVVSDARRLLHLAEVVLTDECEEGASEAIRGAAGLLERLLLQDVKETPEGSGGVKAELREGTARDRVPSATDPQQRHGHKSHSNRFTGHKLAAAVDTDSGIITDVDVLAGNAADAEGALAQVERVEENTGEDAGPVTTDCAYGGGQTREAFAEAGRDLAAKVPHESPNRGLFTKSQFEVDLENNRVSCPGGQTTASFTEDKEKGKVFAFGSSCSGCSLRERCTTSATGRTVQVHPQEALLQAARAYQETEEGRRRLRGRVAVEHALARLSHLGVGQARYVGRAKTRFQMYLAATVANLRRTWNWAQAQKEGPNRGSAGQGEGESEATVRSLALPRALVGWLWGIRAPRLQVGRARPRVGATLTVA